VDDSYKILRPDGNATTAEPVGGFSSPGLKELFHPSSIPGSNPSSGTNAGGSASTSSGADGSTMPTIKKHTSVGAIAGGIIGGLLTLTAILGLILFLLHRKKRKNNQQQRDVPELEATYKDHPILDSAPVFEKSGISVATHEIGVGKSSLSSDGGKSSGAVVMTEPVEMEGSNVLGIMAFSAPPDPAREHISGAPALAANVYDQEVMECSYAPLPKGD
jgi:hypothetical protein